MVSKLRHLRLLGGSSKVSVGDMEDLTDILGPECPAVKFLDQVSYLLRCQDSVTFNRVRRTVL